ncbi:ABC transporter ATP-binding protein [Halobaculum sp. CBA1158]|uniref:ABC transporter ATP-binding protein n=1 Tax=Halobaculum sp. CBA1158 TaxID=2904243 RepID=UPI001F48D601|nr:ABC transporter ATP-binding protein [Halobaculum sp. CBA1158]UIO99352.1 ABC transporter ATP-binding protein [Halobaculum sp. CBA1158]
MNDEPVVRAVGARKSYDGTVALDGVSLDVREGEVFGLIGPNGAGKTTLVRALTGTVDAEGTLELFGDPARDSDRSRLGLLPQEFSPAERLTARELVAYYAGLYDDARPVEAVLADVGLADDADADTWYENLSGGQKRRACVAAALVNDPDVLVLDEPTTGIDPAGRRALWELLESLADGGVTVLLTSHSMDEVERLADRVGLLRDGRLVATGTPAELVAEHGGPARLVVAGPDAEAGAAPLREAGFAVEVGADEVVLGDVSPEDLGQAVTALADAGVDYESLTWTEPTLEDVYLRLTGETFEGAFTPGASAVAGDAAAGDDSTADGDAAAGDDSTADGDAVGDASPADRAGDATPGDRAGDAPSGVER